MDYREIKTILFSEKPSRALIASHRGKFGSSVMENTDLAFMLAMGQGADMMEMDLEMTKDGVIIGHHDDDMTRLFRRDSRVEDYTYDEIRNMPIYNVYGEECGESISTLEEILAALKDKTYLVLDKCWNIWDEVAEVVKKYEMEDQIIMKFYIEDKEYIEWAKKHDEFLYIPMVANPDDKAILYDMQKVTKVIGMEILPEKPDDEFLSREYIHELHEHGLKVWCNSLSLSKRLVYGGGFVDLVSLRYGGDKGWEELIDRGVDIIQTDWVYELRRYMEERTERGV